MKKNERKERNLLGFTEEHLQQINAKRVQIAQEVVDILIKYGLSNEEAGRILDGAKVLFGNLVVTPELYKPLGKEVKN
jgi:hypothetical protein